jgi:peptidoglycan/xylan/chitin deacetylase (PgdA/CDA1 family)
MLLDDDLVCEQTLARKHIAAHQADFSCILFGPRLFSSESRKGLATEIMGSWYHDHADRVTREGAARGRLDIWMDANFSVPRNILLTHGGYDETLRCAEDRDLAIRLFDAGVRFKFLPDAPVYEIYSKTSDDVVAHDAPEIGVSDIYVARKHRGYRRVCEPATIIGESRLKLWAWWICCALPVSPDAMLRIPCSIAERLSRNPGMRRLGIRLLLYRKAVAIMRSATREVGSWQELRHEFGMRLPVLRYVGIVSVERFEADVRWLVQRGYMGIAPSDWLAWVRTGATLPRRPVLMMFDGTSAEMPESALPVLCRYGFRAAVFVVTQHIGGGSARGWVAGRAPQRRMTAARIRYWTGEGIEFGAYSRNHRRLTELESPRLTDEIEGSAADLAQILGRRPAAFAYPYGAVNQAVLEQARQSFAMAFGNTSGLNALATDLHLLRTTKLDPSHRILNLAATILFGRPVPLR